MFYNLVLQFYWKNEQKKKEDDTFLRKKTEEKQNSATTRIYVYGKWKHILKKVILKKIQWI